MSTTTVTVSGQRLRRCWDCRQWKPLPDFHRSRADAEGRTTICAECGRRRSLAYRHANLDEVRRRQRERAREKTRERAAAIERFLAATSAPTNPED